MNYEIFGKRAITHLGFSARIKEAPKLTGNQVHGLPPGHDLLCYPSEAFKNLPGRWKRGPEVYVVPVKPDRGLWFDWTANDALNTAVVSSVKGCNPLTGMPWEDLRLEKYQNQCPKHGSSFTHSRFCPECNYKWPSKGFVSAPDTLWWDGFRSDDGSVRQFFFSEDPSRDIPSHLIGKEATVPAFGFAFYRRKVHKVSLDQMLRLYKDTAPTYQVYAPYYSTTSTGVHPVHNSFYCSTKPSSFISEEVGGQYLDVNSVLQKDSTSSITRGISRANVDVSIGAGAKIAQGVSEDLEDLSVWEDTPSSVMTIYFVFQNEFDQIASEGFSDLEGKAFGMLEGLPVG
jgi:hypothetical protein